MELEFDRDVIQGCEVLADGTVCQEETLESIVPDACPDILRIVAVCGQAALNGKQAKEGLAQASGTMRAVILYQPEAGGGLRRMEAALPFTAQLEAPGLTDRGTVQACVRLRGAEARALNPRKVLLRADLAVDLTAFQPREQVCCQGVLEPEANGVQEKITEGETYQLSAVQEKPFTFSDQVRLNGGPGEAAQLLACRAVPLCGECKLIGTKLIFKGTVELQLLMQEAGGGLTSYHESMPFSQVMEVPGVGESGDCPLDRVFTQYSCEPSGEDGRTLELTVDLLAQAQIWSRRPVSVLQDLYSTAFQTQVEREDQSLWQLLELSSRVQNVRELFETGTAPRSVVDSWASLGEIRRSREGEELVLEGEVQVTVLYLDEEETPQVFQKTMGVACRLEAPAGGPVPLPDGDAGGGLCHPRRRRGGGALQPGVPVPGAGGAEAHRRVRSRTGRAQGQGRGGPALGGPPPGGARRGACGSWPSATAPPWSRSSRPTSWRRGRCPRADAADSQREVKISVAGEFRRLRAAEQGSALRGGFLFHVEKEPKDARGRAQSAGSAKPPCLHAARPLEPPITGNAYLLGFAIFPARKI